MEESERRVRRGGRSSRRIQDRAGAAGLVLGRELVDEVTMRRALRPGEMALCRAILADALDVLTRPPRATKEGVDGHTQQASDRAWLAGAAAPITFEYVCVMLGLEPEAVRRVVAVPRRTLAFRHLNQTGQHRVKRIDAHRARPRFSLPHEGL